MQVHRFETLAVVDGDRAAEDVEGLNDFYHAGGDCADGSSGGRALVDSRVEITGGLSIVKALHTEGRDDAAGDGSDEGIFPILEVGYGVAKGRQRLHFFRGGMERFDLRRESDILRREERFANGQADGGDGGSVFCEEFDRVRSWGIGYGYGHQALPVTTFLLEKTHGAAIQARSGCGDFAAKANSLPQRDRRGLYRALLRAGRRSKQRR